MSFTIVKTERISNSGAPQCTVFTIVAGRAYHCLIGRTTLDTHTPVNPTITATGGNVITRPGGGNDNQIFDNSGATQRGTSYGYMVAAASSGTFQITATYTGEGSASNTADFFVIEDDQNTASPVIQVKANMALNTSWAANVATATFGSALTAGSRVLAMSHGAANARTGSPGTGFTALTQYNPGSTDRYFGEFNNAPSSTTGDFTWDGNESGAIFLIELASLAATRKGAFYHQTGQINRRWLGRP